MVGLAVELGDLGAEVLTHLAHDLFAPREDLAGEHVPPILGDEDQMSVKAVDNAAASTNIRVRLPPWRHGPSG
ncbi:hypothetical protein GCM10023195_35770 [Actinoallomurus liliacearum]|uniref:Uncharacterized protein n=1 Tax=Actinoallomurus liliacearum TaxID=1080073 RepID=A0ABP8TNJ1_9ACTN